MDAKTRLVPFGDDATGEEGVPWAVEFKATDIYVVQSRLSHCHIRQVLQPTIVYHPADGTLRPLLATSAHPEYPDAPLDGGSSETPPRAASITDRRPGRTKAIDVCGARWAASRWSSPSPTGRRRALGLPAELAITTSSPPARQRMVDWLAPRPVTAEDECFQLQWPIRLDADGPERAVWRAGHGDDGSRRRRARWGSSAVSRRYRSAEWDVDEAAEYAPRLWDRSAASGP